MSRLKQLTKDSVIYGIGGIMAKSISFLLLPIYTKIFTPADYGIIEMMTVIVSLLTTFLVMEMDSAQSFYFFKEKGSGKLRQKAVVSAILQWRLTWGLIIVIFTGLVAPFINTWFFNGKLPLHYFLISFSGAFFSTLLSQSVEVFRLLYKPWPYIWVTTANTILAAALILVFVIMFQWGIYGFFLGNMVASALIAGFSWYLVRDYLDFSQWHKSWWPALFKFSAPLLPASLAYYAMSTADRWFVKTYHGAEVLGLYAISAKFALIMALVIEMFRKAWWPMSMDAMHANDGPETFRIIARLYMGLGVAAVIYLSFSSQWLVSQMTDFQFHSAYPVVGILAWQSLFYGFFLIGSAGIWKSEKTYISAASAVIAAVINILLNYLWVPEHGSMGAALATVTAYFLCNVFLLIMSERYWSVEFPVFVMGFQISLGMTAVFFLTWGNLLFIESFILTHVFVILLLASALNRRHWQEVLNRGKRFFDVA